MKRAAVSGSFWEQAYLIEMSAFPLVFPWQRKGAHTNPPGFSAIRACRDARDCARRRLPIFRRRPPFAGLAMGWRRRSLDRRSDRQRELGRFRAKNRAVGPDPPSEGHLGSGLRHRTNTRRQEGGAWSCQATTAPESSEMMVWSTAYRDRFTEVAAYTAEVIKGGRNVQD
jgi:hypothetical protein